MLALKAPRFRSPGTSGRTVRASARRTSPRPRPAPVRPERDKVVEQRPLDQRPEIAPNPHIGLQALRGAALEAKRVLAVDSHQCPRHWCGTSVAVRPPSSLDAHLDRQKRRVVDPDADLLDRRHQDIAVAVLAQDRGEQLRPAAPGRSASRNKTMFRRQRCACRYRRSRADPTGAPAPGRASPRRPPRRVPAEPASGGAAPAPLILALVCGRI